MWFTSHLFIEHHSTFGYHSFEKNFWLLWTLWYQHNWMFFQQLFFFFLVMFINMILSFFFLYLVQRCLITLLYTFEFVIFSLQSKRLLVIFYCLLDSPYIFNFINQSNISHSKIDLNTTMYFVLFGFSIFFLIFILVPNLLTYIYFGC